MQAHVPDTSRATLHPTERPLGKAECLGYLQGGVQELDMSSLSQAVS